MQLPTPLLRKNPKAYKNTFGHALILAGSRRMLGAAALCGLSSMRAGAGLTTLGVPKSLNSVLQKKISPVLMTWPLPETKNQTFSATAWTTIKKEISKFQAVAIGPGLSCDKGAQAFACRVIKSSLSPLVIDADALNALAENLDLLKKTDTPKILTPHLGEFMRLINGERRTKIVKESFKTKTLKKEAAKKFSQKHNCFLVLKDHRTIVASPDGKVYVNQTGNAGMATAGSGDVLAGMIAAFLAQGLNAFDAAKYGVYLHGRAGDLAARKLGKTGIIASDIIDYIPSALTGLRIKRIKD